MWKATRDIPLHDADGNVIAHMSKGEYLIPASVAAKWGHNLLRQINDSQP